MVSPPVTSGGFFYVGNPRSRDRDAQHNPRHTQCEVISSQKITKQIMNVPIEKASAQAAAL